MRLGPFKFFINILALSAAGVILALALVYSGRMLKDLGAILGIGWPEETVTAQTPKYSYTSVDQKIPVGTFVIVAIREITPTLGHVVARRAEDGHLVNAVVSLPYTGKIDHPVKLAQAALACGYRERAKSEDKIFVIVGPGL